MGGVDVAIVGIGAVFPGAPDAPAFWRNIAGGVDAVTAVPDGRWGTTSGDRFYCRRGGFVDELATFDPMAFGVMPSTVDVAEPDQLLALSTAAEAIADAGGEAALPDRSRIGVVVGRGGYLTPGCARLDQRVALADQVVTVLRDLFPGMADLDAVREAVQDKLGPDQPEASIGLVPNLAASRIANRFDLRGTAYTVDAACASGLVAVEHAVRELASGRADAMLAGAVHLCHHPTLWSVFTQLRALSPTERIRPFDRDADGTLLSEGVGMVLLKRLSDTADDRVYAVIRGVGTASDGRATSMMTPNPDGQLLAVHRAWREAGLDPLVDSPGLVEAHGTATPAGDAAELGTMINAFGRSGAPIGIGTVKSMIGHAMPAAGMAGLIKAALALHHGILPPTLHIDEPHEAIAGTRFEPVWEAREWDGPRRAVVNAFGFGGINAHVVLEAPRHAAAISVRTPVITYSADSLEQLAADLRADRQSQADRDFRLVIGNPDARKRDLAARVVARGRQWTGRHDIWFAPAPMITTPDQVAFLFPGFEHRGTGELAESGDVLDHALSLLRNGRQGARELTALGVTPGALAGHSMGEWTAMVVAGIYPTIDEFVRAVDPASLALADISYAALGCSALVAQSAMDGVAGVSVSHDNCPHQSVICGPADQLAVVIDRLHTRGVLAQLMPFRTGFHTPALAPHLDGVRATMDALPVHAPRIPVWSATSLEPMPDDPGEIRSLVLRHLVEPVRFRPLTQRLHEAGFRAFVQVGSGSLTGFVADTLGERPHLAVSGSADVIAAALWAFGLKRGTRRRLSLGVPSVRLDPIGTAPVASELPDSPVSAQVNALLSHTNAVAREIASALVPPAPQEMGFTREFSLHTMPELVDHSVFPQPGGWPDLADGFPIVPATGLLEVFADAAMRLTGSAVHGFADVRAKRWLAVLPGVDVRIAARVDGPGRVHVRVGDYAEGIVLTAPVSRDVVREPLRGVRPAPVNATELYVDNWMFHGPAFAGVTKISSLADNGIAGVLQPLPAPGALLDSAGQLIGHWMQVSHTVDQTVLPTGIEEISLHGPVPTAPVACTAWIRTVTPTAMTADADLTVDGVLWCRITGWTTRRFTTDDRIWAVKLRPGTEMLSVASADGVLVRENWVDSATRDLIMRRYLNSAERALYEGMDVPAQRSWLLRAIAAKDAVRSHLWSRGAGPIYPAELTVADGRVRGAFAIPPVTVTDGPGHAHARVEG
ncbi:acyltransferase domain-containing protein [Lentzea tibetensis]|uniref:Acyltransferase domain-containing protein n=1 Tax=Lentzea tibetensis TaxID=2591470 RepID=A0A563F2U5_9PSEU|nr:beta-ketoacyl synthase N-terminal-like domain-containing protein [Lentzea tibetensis]TWP53684.1 acyltransferase domain-containing protein [Lentzea tibetensis]